MFSLQYDMSKSLQSFFNLLYIKHSILNTEAELMKTLLIIRLETSFKLKRGYSHGAKLLLREFYREMRCKTRQTIALAVQLMSSYIKQTNLWVV